MLLLFSMPFYEGCSDIIKIEKSFYDGHFVNALVNQNSRCGFNFDLSLSKTIGPNKQSNRID